MFSSIFLGLTFALTLAIPPELSFASTLILAATPIPSVTPASAGVPNQTATPERRSITGDEKKTLSAQFKKTLADEARARDHQERSSLKEFVAAQARQVKEWRNKEKRTRRIFFDEHMSGPERRDYVQNYISRQKEFKLKQASDIAAFKTVLKEKSDALQLSQKNREIQFNQAIEQNERPSRKLWSP